MEKFTSLTAPVLVLPERNIDTDQIIPARFLTTTSSGGMGEGAFADWRLDAEGHERPDCVLNEPRARTSPILVAGHNFGCGSSREHAPWALLQFGFRVVVSSKIADIFRINALNVGLLAIELPAEQHDRLLELDGVSLTVDLETQAVRLPGDAVFRFSIDAFARYCLLNGMDRLDFLLAAEPAIAAFEVDHER